MEKKTLILSQDFEKGERSYPHTYLRGHVPGTGNSQCESLKNVFRISKKTRTDGVGRLGGAGYEIRKVVWSGRSCRTLRYKSDYNVGRNPIMFFFFFF